MEFEWNPTGSTNIKDGMYLITVQKNSKNGVTLARRELGHWYDIYGRDSFKDLKILAWSELPKPYGTTDEDRFKRIWKVVRDIENLFDNARDANEDIDDWHKYGDDMLNALRNANQILIDNWDILKDGKLVETTSDTKRPCFL